MSANPGAWPPISGWAFVVIAEDSKKIDDLQILMPCFKHGRRTMTAMVAPSRSFRILKNRFIRKGRRVIAKSRLLRAIPQCVAGRLKC